MQERWKEIQAIWQSNQVLYVIAGFLAGILFFPTIEALSADASDLLSGFVPEAVGIAFTVLLIERIAFRRARSERKAELIRWMNSQDNALASQAVVELAYHDWLYDGSFSGKFFHKANLKNVDFMNANLEYAVFTEVNFENARFWNARLSHTSLVGCNLNCADFGLNTLGYQAWLDETTQLPDGLLWTPGTDMNRYTDPNHLDFWEPDWVKERREQE